MAYKDPLLNMKRFNYCKILNSSKSNSSSEMTSITLTFEEIKRIVFMNILSSGDFRCIRRCSPQTANCIVRVYSRENFVVKPSYSICIYGADVITSKYPLWSHSSNVFNIDYSRHLKKISLPTGENVEIDFDFVDYYIHLD